MQAHALQMWVLHYSLSKAHKPMRMKVDTFEQATANNFPAADLTMRLDALQQITIAESENDMCMQSHMQSRLKPIENVLVPIQDPFP